jgi:short-subunit dehydrogenase
VALPPPAPGSTALVTGASAGIGVELATQLAERGHGLTLVARRQELLDRLASELSSKHGIQVDVIPCDLGDPAARDALAARVQELGRTVEILVNNAGFATYGPFAEAQRDRELGQVRLNVEALLDLTARYLPGMVERGRGTVIQLASTAGFQPLPRNATYSATKAFVLHHTESLHTELKGTGVTITAVCPGPVKTEFAESAGLGKAEQSVPDMAWSSAADVARAAIKAADAGKRSVIPGIGNQIGAIAGRHAPRTFLLPTVNRIYKRIA